MNYFSYILLLLCVQNCISQNNLYIEIESQPDSSDFIHLSDLDLFYRDANPLFSMAEMERKIRVSNDTKANKLLEILNANSWNLERKLDSLQTLTKEINFKAQNKNNDVSEFDLLNDIYFKNGEAKNLKLLIKKTTETHDLIIKKFKLDSQLLKKKLEINLWMQEENISWEEYTFNNMPSIAIIPILNYYKTNLLITNYFILYSIVKKLK